MKKERVLEIIENFKSKRVAIIGDLMLDEYIWGKASRISPEAPVPIVHIKERTDCLGGASNVMRNVVTIGGNVSACGVIGDDENGARVRELLASYSINDDCLFSDSERITIKKQRVMASNQQLLRIDFEDTCEVKTEYREKIVSKIEELAKAKEIDAIILEDYAKGLLDVETAEKINNIAFKNDIFITLDPHPGHPLKTNNLTLMTPNRMEAFGLAGIYHSDKITPVEDDKALMEVAAKLAKEWAPKYLLITLGSQGMALFEKGKEPVIIPTRAREVFDVSGAGDTVIAAFTLGLLGGATGAEAAEFANNAAGVVVGKVGTVSVDINELLESF